MTDFSLVIYAGFSNHLICLISAHCKFAFICLHFWVPRPNRNIQSTIEEQNPPYFFFFFLLIHYTWICVTVQRRKYLKFRFVTTVSLCQVFCLSVFVSRSCHPNGQMFFQKRVLAQLSWGLVSPCSLLTCVSEFTHATHCNTVIFQRRLEL